jgi:hypothetical protein
MFIYGSDRYKRQIRCVEKAVLIRHILSNVAPSIADRVCKAESALYGDFTGMPSLKCNRHLRERL